MKEEASVICCWKKSRSGYKLWVKSQPQVVGEGENYEDAEDELMDAIRESLRVMTPFLVFDPPLPKIGLEAQFSDPELYIISGNTRFETPRQRPLVDKEKAFQEADYFYEKPLCHKCCHSKSLRSTQPIVIEYIDSSFDAAIGYASQISRSPIYIYSERFLDSLTKKERASLQFQQVERRKRSRKIFYELLGPAGLPTVAVKDLNASGWICSSCCYRTFGYFLKDVAIHSFVSKSDLPDPLPELFTIGKPPEVRLCATRRRWQKLLQKGLQGLAISPVGVVSKSRLVRNPKLMTS